MNIEGQSLISSEESPDYVTGFDLHLFNEGTHLRLYEKLGAHLTAQNGLNGTHFAVWAPNASTLR